ncbi:hypothetical protein N5P37_010029 [Trichoderma harzianum]|uniref:NAD-dependent epimerase/dehydratase domain-containing protein n=1 Tax=Trichoderma harzianum CBS 226.95 TaxID=983964 RepID=A0A2T4A5E8_TRIHA|nr:hypothetical protein M431DRAFT_18634 [Trichoderma harzianum CBS 226.95]KAK0757309.1 hypothetical protein N5P37_010029 [Trichoderma harzianum]PKK51542.1 hypothetical protein CI102_2971 [Trichoderma harzianum]PTB52274.1 hypothetical protein M431DRAFT_18634 [Trichoderma harzianum CBS 226.95]
MSLETSGEFHVIAPVRSEKDTQSTLALHPEYSDKNVRFPVVPDLGANGACDEIFRETEINYVIHAAGRFRFENIDPQKLIYDNYDTAKSAEKFGKSLKRFVLTGSVIVEITGQMKPSTFKEELTEADIVSIPLEAVRESGDSVACYVAAKAESSSLLFETASKSSVSWDAVELLPAGTAGPLAHSKEIPPVPMFQITDVRDVALAHVLALRNEKASGQRINVVNSDSCYSHQMLANLIRSKYPELRDKVAEGTPEQLIPAGMVFYKISNAKSKEIFGNELNYTPESDTYNAYVDRVREAMRNRDLEL